MRFGGPVLLLNPVLALVLNLVKRGAAAPVLNLALVLPGAVALGLNLVLALRGAAAPVLNLNLALVLRGAAAPVLVLNLALPLNLPLALLKTAARSTPLPPGPWRPFLRAASSACLRAPAKAAPRGC